MSLQLPTVSIGFQADLSKLTADMQRVTQLINQASAQTRPITIQANTSAATTQVTALINQLRSLTGEMRAQDQANAQQRAAIAALVAQQAALRAALSQTVEQLRISGASAKEIAAAHGNLRSAMLQSTAAIAAQRGELASGVSAQGQYRNAIASTREQLKLLEGDAQKASAAQKASNAGGGSGGGGGGGGGGFGLGDGLRFAAEAIAIRDVGAAFAGTIKEAINWQTTLNQIQGNTTMTTADIQGMDTAVRTMAANSPASMDQLAAGFRHAANEGFNLADSTKIAQAGMESAVSTGANVGSTIDVLATTMKIFGVNANDAGKAMDVLHLAAAQGNTTLEEFTGSASRALSTAANLGASLVDTTAAISALTRNGFSATEAGTQVTGMLTHIINPAKEAQKEIAALSQSTGVDLVRDFSAAGLKSQGLAGILTDLQKVVEITGDASIVTKLIPALRGGQGALALTGNAANDYKEILQSLQEVIEGRATPTADAYARTLDTVGGQFGILKNTITLLAIQFGTVLLPILKEGIKILQELGNAIGEAFHVPGLDALAKGQEEHNAQVAQGKTAMEQLGVAEKATGAAGAKAAADTTEGIARQHDATDVARAAVGALNDALGLSNGASGVGGATQNIASLGQIASGDAARAVADLNRLLQLPDGTIGPGQAVAALGEMKDAASAVSLVIHNLDAELASVKASMDSLKTAQTALHDQYDPIMKNATDAIAKNDRPNYERLGQQAQLQAEHVRLQIEKPDTTQYTNAIKEAQEGISKIQADATNRNSGLGGFDDQLTAARKKVDDLGSFDASGYESAIKGIQDNTQRATQAISDQIKAIQESTRGATEEYTNQIKAVQEAGRAAAEAYDATIGTLREKASHLGEGATDKVDGEIQSLRDHIASLNTDALDEKINRLKDTLNAPPPNTMGLKNQLTALAAQIQMTTDVAERAKLVQQFGVLSASKAGIETNYTRGQVTGAAQLKVLENEKRDTVSSNREARHDDEDAIRGLGVQRKAILDTITDQKRAIADQIVGVEHQKKAAADASADVVRGLEAQKKAATDASAAQIRGLEAQKVSIERAAKSQEEGIKRNRAAAEVAFKAQKEAAVDEVKGIELAQKAAAQADRVAIAGFNAQIASAKELSDNLLAPWKALDAANVKQTEALKLLDEQDKAARDIANLPLHKVYDEAKAALDAGLAPLLVQQHALEERQRTLQEEKTHWEGIKTRIDDAKRATEGLVAANKALKAAGADATGDPAPQKPGGLGGSGYAGMTNPADMLRVPAVNRFSAALAEASKKLQELHTFLREHPVLVRLAAAALGAFVATLVLLKAELVVAAGIREMGSAIKDAGMALSLLGTTGGIVVVAIAALALGFKLLYDNCRPFHVTINEILTTFKEKGLGAAFLKAGEDLGKLGGFVVDFVQEAAPLLLAQLQAWGDAFLKWVEPRIAPFLAELEKIAVAALGWIGEKAGDLIARLVEWGDAFLKWIEPRIPPFLAELQKIAVALLGWIGEKTGDLIGKLGEWATAFVDWVSPKIPQLLTELGALGLRLLGWIGEKIPELVAKLLQWGEAFTSWIGPKIPPFLTELGRLALALLGWVGEKAVALGTKLLEWGAAMIGWIAPKIVPFIEQLGLLWVRFLGWIAEKAIVLGVEILVWGVKFIAWVATHIPLLIVEVNLLLARLLAWIIESLPQITAHMARWGEAFLQWIIDIVPKLPGELAKLTLTIGNWVNDKAVPFLRDAGHQIANAFLEGFKGLGSDIVGPINEAIHSIDDFLRGIEGAVHAVGDLFGIGDLKSFKVTLVPQLMGAGQAGPPQYAKGTASHPGGPAIVGEDGRELVKRQGQRNTGPLGWELVNSPTLIHDLPAGATVLPNALTEALLGAGIPGFAGGLGDILNGANDLLGGAKDKLASLIGMGIEKVTSTVTDHLPPLNLKGVAEGAGKSLYGSAAEGIVNLVKSLWAKLHHDAPKSAGGNRSFSSGGGALMDAILAATRDDHTREAMAFGAGAETGGGFAGPWPDQGGGGPAVGPFQIEALPGGSHYGEISAEDARDPFKAAVFMTTGYNYDYGVPTVAEALWQSNFDEAAHLAALHSERPHDDYNPEQQARGRAMAEAMRDRIVKGVAPSGGNGFTGPSEWGAVVSQAMRHLGETNQADGTTWNGWCEKFMDDMEDAAGFGSYRAPTAYLHGLHARETGALNANSNAPAGASVWFDTSWGPAGHAAIATGNGSETISTPIDNDPTIHYANIIGSHGYMGWAPPGMATGGVFTSPQVVTVGDIPGRVPEIIAPQPMMKRTVTDAILDLGRRATGIPDRATNRDSGSGETEITVVFETGSINVDRDGVPTVNKAPLTLRRAKVLAGIAG